MASVAEVLVPHLRDKELHHRVVDFNAEVGRVATRHRQCLPPNAGCLARASRATQGKATALP